MSKLIEFFKALLPHIKSQSVYDDEYLAESVDIFDLERRMREIDARNRDRSGGLSFGLNLR